MQNILTSRFNFGGYGASPEVLKECDAIVELPMFGVNKSLNVMVSLGIVLYEVIEKTS